MLTGSIHHLIIASAPVSNTSSDGMCVLWYVITAHSHIRGATTGAGCLYGSCWCDYQRRWANIAKSSKHTSSIWLLHNYYRYNVKPKYPLISYVDVCLMAVLYTDAGDECCIITIEWWYWVEMAWLQPCRGRRDYVDWCTVRDYVMARWRISFWSFSGYSGKSLE